MNLRKLDKDLFARFRIRSTNKFINFLCLLIAHSGDSLVCIAAVLLFYILGRSYFNPFAFFLAGGLVVSTLISLLVKSLFKRKRPAGGWGRIYRKTDPYSFPSGHAVRTFNIAVFLLFAGSLPWGVGLLVWSVIVGFVRIGKALHYPSDVAVGAALGIIIGIGSAVLYNVVG